jgi:hypothetical protein
MTFVIDKMFMIVLHHGGVLSGCLPGSFNKQSPKEGIAAEGNASGMSSFSTFSYSGDQAYITA